MKFGKSLKYQIEETLPEWRDKFLSYKELKKRLKLVAPKGSERPNKRARVEVFKNCSDDGEKDGMSKEEIDFISLLEDEVVKFNTFFIEKEEEYIIVLKELQDKVATAKLNESNEEVLKIKKEIVDLHGEMVLLENYSALNYTGLAKILKKYDKRTGAVLRLPFIQKVIQEPFFTTDLLFKLVKQCETMLDRFFPETEQPSSTSVSTTNDCLLQLAEELEGMECMGSLHMKSTVSAIRALKAIRGKSSTVSVFSFPPLQTNGLEDSWRKTPHIEEVAK